MAKEPFVSGVFRSEYEFRQRPRSIESIIGRAVIRKHWRGALDHPLDSASMLAIQRATYRMIGERHPVDEKESAV